MKYYLVAGASSGIGRAAAKSLSDEETGVVLVARRRERLEALAQELTGESIVLPADLGNVDDIGRVYDELKSRGIKLDGMVYTAGSWYIRPFKAMQPHDLEEMFRINTFGFYEMCRRFQSTSASNSGSAIVGISSYAATSREAGLSAYSMSKAAMNVQAEVLARELVRRKIRINTIQPAIVLSRMAEDDNTWTDEQLEEIRGRQPLGGIPIDAVVRVIRFLLSDDAAYITGQSIAMNAGYKEIR